MAEQGTRNVAITPGTVLGDAEDSRWEVRRHLRDGGFSSVYAVRPASPETAEKYGTGERALKCLWGTPAELTQIGGEADKIAAVDGHDNVLGLVTNFRFALDDRPHDQFVGIVLDLAVEDLYAFRDRAHPTETAWAAVFEQVAAGLDHIHSRRIVHGDIKPTNILRVGADFKIADFGVSAPMESTRSAGIGWARTLSYWPPESDSQGEVGEDGVRRPPEGGWRASQSSDVWALAVSIHRVLTGRHITAGVTPEQQYELVCKGRYSVDDRLSEAWRRLLTDCLVFEPERRRVTTAAQLRRRLAEIAVSEDYLGVPWGDHAPRVVALFDGDPAADGPGMAILMYVTHPHGRVQGTLVAAADITLDAVKHLHGVAVPALAQQVRDAQRTANRYAEERDQLRDELERRAEQGDGGATQLVEQVDTGKLKAVNAELTSVTQRVQQLGRDRDRLIREIDEVAAARDRLSAERDALSREAAELVKRMNRMATQPPQAGTTYLPTRQPPPRRPRASAAAVFLRVVVVLVLVILVGIVVLSQWWHVDPIDVVRHLQNKGQS